MVIMVFYRILPRHILIHLAGHVAALKLCCFWICATLFARLRVCISPPSSLEATNLFSVSSSLGLPWYLTIIFSFFMTFDSLDILPFILSACPVSHFKTRAQLTMWRCPLLASGAAEMAEAEKEGVNQTQRNKKRLRENSLAEAQTSCLLWPS